MGVFALGGFVCATSIIRTNAVAASVANKKDSTCEQPFPSRPSLKTSATNVYTLGTFIPRSTWTLVESNVGIICACLPMFRSVLAPCLPCLDRKRESTTTRPSGYSQTLGSSSHTQVTSEGHVMSSMYHNARGKKEEGLNESQEEIFATSIRNEDKRESARQFR